MAFLYILESYKDFSYYVGITENVAVRVARHNAGAVRSTKARRPWKLRLVKECATLQQARSLEVKIKSWKKRIAIENFMNRESSMAKVGP